MLARLVLAGRISADAAVRATATAQEQRQSLAAAVTSLGLITSRDWAEAVARHYDFELVGPLTTCRASRCWPTRSRRASCATPRCCRCGPPTTRSGWPWPTPATATPSRPSAWPLQRRVVPVIAALEDLQKAYARYWDAGQSALQRIVDDIGEDLTGELSADVEHLIGAAQEAPVVRLVNQLLTDALRLHASDIHIEPARDHLRVRYRVHGRLREAGAPPARLSAAVISRIKILAKLDIAERRLPQDGRARLTLLGRRIDLRVATAPSVHGESLVIRILDQSAQGGDFADLGLGRRAGGQAAARAGGTARHAAGHRPDRQRQDDDALCGAAPPQQGQRQADQHRGPDRVPDRRHHPDPGHARRSSSTSPACCARSSATTPT